VVYPRRTSAAMNACSFSHNRGGEKKKCGFTRGGNSVTRLGRAAHHAEARGHRQVVRAHALGDVGHRQIGDRALPRLNSDQRAHLGGMVRMFACVSSTPLGGPVVPDV